VPSKGPSRFVLEAIERRVAAGVCTLCGSPFKPPSKIKLKPNPTDKPECSNPNCRPSPQQFYNHDERRRIVAQIKREERAKKRKSAPAVE
jgi:hypothetical protein